MELEKNSKRIRKNSLNMFRNRIVAIIILFSSCSIFAQAQIWAFILEGLISAGEEYSYQMELDKQIEQEVKTAVNKLNSVEFKRAELDKIGKAYNTKSKSSNNMEEEMSNYVHSLLYFMNNVGINDMANGGIEKSATLYQDSLIHIMEVISLEEILNRQVLDSLKMYEEKLSEEVLKDIRKDIRICYILNSDPRVVRIYKNSMSSNLRMNPAHLSYWASVKDESHIMTLPKNVKLLNPYELMFRNENIYKGDRLIATHSDEYLYVYDIELLNLVPKPKTIYRYNNISYYTDNIGRVVKVEQVVSLSDKGKCLEKTKLKSKHFTPLKSTETLSKAYNIGLLNYMAPDSYINTTFISETPENLLAIRDIKKKIKKEIKTKDKVKIVTELIYSGGGQYCKTLTVKIEGTHIATINN